MKKNNTYVNIFIYKKTRKEGIAGFPFLNMRNKLYYLAGIFLVISIAVVAAIFLTSKNKGSVIDLGIPSGEKASRRVSSIILSPGTSQNLYFHKSGWFLKKIEFRLPDLTDTEYTVKALVTIKGKKPQMEDWSTIGRKTYCLNKRNEKMTDVVLSIINNSASSTMKGEIQSYAMKDGCDEWSGTFKYEWTDTKTKKSEQGILQATFSLKENAYATEYVTADGGYTYNLLGCDKEDQVKTYTMLSDGFLGENTLRLAILDDGSLELKLPIVWGNTSKATEYIKKNRLCIYGKEKGDTINDLGEQKINTLSEVLAEKLVLTPDPITGNLKGSKEITKTLEDGTVRKVKISWDMVRQ